jgi:hypothetical protein
MGRRVTTIAGIAGFGSLLAGVGGPKVIEGLPPWVNIALFGAGAVLILAAFVSHLLSRKEDERSGVNQTSHGSYSPNIYGPVRDVHIHPIPAATQPSRSPYGGRIRRAEDRPGRIRNNLSSYAEPLVRRLEAEKAAEAKMCPAMPIAKAVEHVRAVIGDTNDGNCYPEARRQIRQAALEGRVEIWGRRQIPLDHMKSPLAGSEVWTSIAPEHWEEYELSAYATDPMFANQPHTQPESWRGTNLTRHWELKVREKQIRRIWKHPPETTNAGKP